MSRKVTIEQKPNGFYVENGDGEGAFFNNLPEAFALCVIELKAQKAFARPADDVTLTIETNASGGSIATSNNVRQISTTSTK